MNNGTNNFQNFIEFLLYRRLLGMLSFQPKQHSNLLLKTE